MNKQFITRQNNIIARVSNWITIKTNYHPSKTNSLYYYATDENGYKTGSKNFNENSDLFLDYFTWNKRNWAIEQFILFGGMWGGTPPSFVENRKTIYLTAYDSEDYYDPIMIEVNKEGDKVRVYKTVSLDTKLVELIKIKYDL